jgi:hypothetical protein
VCSSDLAIKELPRVEFMALANVIAAHQADLWESQDNTDSATSLEFLCETEEEEERFETEEELEYAGF